MTVSDLDRRMTASEIYEWVAYLDIMKVGG